MGLMEKLAWMDSTWVVNALLLYFQATRIKGSVTGKKGRVEEKNTVRSTKCNLLGNGWTLFLSDRDLNLLLFIII